MGLVRGVAGTALVGNPDEVKARMEEYRKIGIDTFIMSGYPHLEEASSCSAHRGLRYQCVHWAFR